ncbi:hypothetical protein KCU93_g5, partial [Aureobasidium melanogenum]
MRDSSIIENDQMQTSRATPKACIHDGKKCTQSFLQRLSIPQSNMHGWRSPMIKGYFASSLPSTLLLLDPAVRSRLCLCSRIHHHHHDDDDIKRHRLQVSIYHNSVLPPDAILKAVKLISLRQSEADHFTIKRSIHSPRLV